MRASCIELCVEQDRSVVLPDPSWHWYITFCSRCAVSLL